MSLTVMLWSVVKNWKYLFAVCVIHTHTHTWHCYPDTGIPGDQQHWHWWSSLLCQWTGLPGRHEGMVTMVRIKCSQTTSADGSLLLRWHKQLYQCILWHLRRTTFKVSELLMCMCLNTWIMFCMFKNGIVLFIKGNLSVYVCIGKPVLWAGLVV